MRNRRNTRKRNVVLDTITNRNFIIIVSILLAVIIVAEGVIQIRKYQDRKLLAKQAEELEKQTGEIFTAIENNLTNPSNNGETIGMTRTARISAVGDILCQMDMIDDAKIDDGYDFSHMFTGISKFVNWQSGGEFISIKLYSIVEEVLDLIKYREEYLKILNKKEFKSITNLKELKR